MEPYKDASAPPPAPVEAHQDQYTDQTLAQLQQSFQQAHEDATQQLNTTEQQQTEASCVSISLSASLNTAADTDNIANTEASCSPHLQDTEDVASPAAAADEEEATAAPVATDNTVASPADGLQAAAVDLSPAGPASVASDKSCEDESDWQMVSPHGSVHVPSSGRYSFEYQGIASPTLEVASESGCSGSDTTCSPRDELAESILGNSVLMAAASSTSAGHLAAAAAVELHHGSDDGMEAVRAASVVSSEGGLDGLTAVNGTQQLITTGSENSTDAAAASSSAVAAAEGARSAEAEITAMVQQSVEGNVDAEVLTGLGLLGSGLREWLMESLAALIQTGRVSHATCMSYTESIQRSLQLMAKQGGLAAAAVGAATNWRVVLSSAAAVVCLAMWLKTRNEAAALRAMLRRRDHELSKLVMRLVSLQELLNQGQALPITRYMRYEGTSTVAASYM